jgi:hypothetical protein
MPSTCTRTYQKGGVGVLCTYTSIVTRGIDMFAYSLEVKKHDTVPWTVSGSIKSSVGRAPLSK